MSQTVTDLFRLGCLADAITAQTAAVKASPLDPEGRVRLAELLSFQGEFDRADKLLDAAGTQRPESAMSIALLRQLVRAAIARRQTFAEGRVPEFLADPPEWLRSVLYGLSLLRAGDCAEALDVLASAEARRPAVAGTCDGKPFDNLRDLDDVCAGFFEVLTSTGKYFWVPMEIVESVEFRSAQRATDLLWRRAEMSVAGGPQGEVFLPAMYDGDFLGTDAALLLGRATQWEEEEGRPIRGKGQRCLLVGGEAVPVMEMRSLTLTRHRDGAG